MDVRIQILKQNFGFYNIDYNNIGFFLLQKEAYWLSELYTQFFLK